MLQPDIWWVVSIQDSPQHHYYRVALNSSDEFQPIGIIEVEDFDRGLEDGKIILGGKKKIKKKKVDKKK